MCRSSSSAQGGVRPHGFSLMELLVVLSMIALLIALLIPALSRVRTASGATRVTSNVRQMQAAHLAYTSDERGRVLPGYLDSSSAYATAEDGSSITGRPAQMYPWRLGPWFNYDWNLLFYDNPLPEVDPAYYGATSRDRIYLSAVFPQIGLNTQFVGGSVNAYAFNQTAIERWGQFYVDRLSDSPLPSRQIVFASSIYSEGGRTIDLDRGYGHHEIIAPYFGERNWNLDRPENDRRATDVGYIAAKWERRAAVSFLDGHAGAATLEELDDMMKWAPLARSAQYVVGGGG